MRRALFGQGANDQLIYIDDTGCLGNESRLLDCPAQGTGDHDCTHLEDAGVRCKRKLDKQGSNYSPIYTRSGFKSGLRPRSAGGLSYPDRDLD